VHLNAVNNVDIGAIGGGLALVRANDPNAQSSSAIAGALSLNVVKNTTAAYVDNSQLKNFADLDIAALAGGEQFAIAQGLAMNISSSAAAKENSKSVAGSIAVSLLTNTVSAKVSDGSWIGADENAETVNAAKLNILAYDHMRLGTGGGSVVTGGKGGFGIGLAVSIIDGTTEATLSDSSLHGATANVHAQTASNIYSGAASAGWSSDAKDAKGFSGSFAVNTISNKVHASIDNASVDLSGELSVKASDGANAQWDAAVAKASISGVDYSAQNDGVDASVAQRIRGAGSSIVSVAGALQGGSSGVGAGVEYSDIQNTLDANIKKTDVNVHGDIKVDASSSAYILGVAAAASATSQEFGFAGAASTNNIHNTVNASISSDQADRKTIAANAVTVSAQDSSQIDGVAGAGALSTGKSSQATVGVGIVVNTIENPVTASISNVDISVANTVNVQAENDAIITIF